MRLVLAPIPGWALSPENGHMLRPAIQHPPRSSTLPVAARSVGNREWLRHLRARRCDGSDAPQVQPNASRREVIQPVRCRSPERVFDSVLAALERHHLSPVELRILLRLSEREATSSQLTAGLGGEPGAICHARRCLSMRGLVRRRFDGGCASCFVFSISPAGLRLLDPLMETLVVTNSQSPLTAEEALV